MYTLKSGVLLVLTGTNKVIIQAVDEALHDFGLHAHITSGADGIHRHESKHFYNAAVDFRSAIWPGEPGGWKAEQQDGILRRVREKLPPGYRYMLEGDHLHVERMTIPDNLERVV